jgi:uncharacterized protein (DUF2062 family)
MEPGMLRARWQRAVAPVRESLGRGLTPERVALALAVGAAAGLFPVVGTTTLLGFALGAALRLNLAVVQVGNWLVSPVQLLLLLPLVRLGRWLAGTPRGALATLSPDALGEGVRGLAQGGVDAILGWLVVAPIAVPLAYAVAVRLLRRPERAARARQVHAAVPAAGDVP